MGGDNRSKAEIVDYLKSKYSVSSVGEIKRYLGVTVTIGNGPWRLGQSHKIEEFLKEHKIKMSKSSDRPGDPSIKYEEMKDGPQVSQPHYQLIVRGLLWFVIMM